MSTRDKTIILDVDGVCADFVGATLGITDHPFAREKITRWDYFDMFRPTLYSQLQAALTHPDFWIGIPPIEGAADGIRRLQVAGYDIVFATVAWEACTGWESARRYWLERHFDARSDQIMIGPRKDLLACRAIVDDKPRTIEACQKAGNARECFIYPASYNAECEAPRFDWQTLGGLI